MMPLRTPLETSIKGRTYLLPFGKVSSMPLTVRPPFQLGELQSSHREMVLRVSPFNNHAEASA